MQDFLENAKRVANSAVERAAWEADRLRRVNARQHEIDLAERERATLLEQLGGTLLELDQRGELTQDPLRMIAQRLRTLESDVSRNKADVAAIRGETFKPGTVSITVTRQDATPMDICPTCGKLVRAGAGFCPSCGARLK
jgi:uncharacterized coiled-coil protein SlyX